MRLILPLLAFTALPAIAQELPLPISCSGAAPDWSMELTEDGTIFTFQQKLEFDIGLVTIAQGSDWPRAVSLAGRGGTAIAILSQLPDGATCEGSNTQAVVLSQQGQTPIMLNGCCTTAQD